jgi:CHAT domain-containing protein
MPRYMALMILALGFISSRSVYSSGLPSQNSVNQRIESLLAACDTLLQQGHIAAGKKMIEAAEDLLRHNNPNHLVQFRYCAQKGRYFAFCGQHDQALQWFHLASIQAASLKNQYPRDIARMYGDMGALFSNTENYPDAIKYYQLACSIQPDALFNDQIEAAYFKACLANSYYNISQAAAAVNLMQSCKTFLESIDDPSYPALLDLYLTMAEYYLSVGQHHTLLEQYLRNATIILNRFYPVNHFKYGILYCLKGSYNYDKFDSENALQFCNRSMQIVTAYPSLYHYQIKNYEIMAGTYYYFHDDYKKAIAFCNKIITGLENTPQSPAIFYYIIGLSYVDLNDRKQAEYFYKKAILSASSSNSSGANITCSQAYFNLSKLYQYKNQPEQSKYYLTRALEMSQRISERGGSIPLINKAFALLYYHNKDYRKSLVYIQRSIIAACKSFADTSVLLNPPLSDMQSTFNLIEIYNIKAYLLYMLYTENNKDLKYLESAFDCQELAAQLTQKIVIDINEENAGLNVVNIRKKSMDNAVSYATLLYLKTGKRIYAEKALAFAEKSKMQVLLINSVKKSKLIDKGVPDSLIYSEKALHDEILEIENQLALIEKGDSPGIKNNPLVRLTLLYDRREELTKQLEEKYPAYGRSKYDVDVVGIEKIQFMLGNEQVILEYQLLESEIITFVIEKNDFSIHYQLIDSLVTENIRKLRSVVATDPTQADPDSAFKLFTNASYYLFGKLIEPVYDKIKGKRLIIIPHNDLTLIPYEILISKKPEDNQPPEYKSLHYLIKEFPIVYAYSANLLLNQYPGKNYGSGTAIFLPDYKSYKGNKKQPLLPVLKGAASEAATIKKLSNGRLFRGSHVNESVFKSKAKDYRVLHIASHTLLNEKNPSLSCLVMTVPADSTEDGNLYVYELNQMDLNAQLVVLSGCNTGFGVLRKSEGLISIARSFFYTGVRTVMYTLWPVADEAGALIISNFYKELKQRHLLDDALRTSKLDFLKNADPVKAHPYYWAGYVIVGKTDNVPLKRFPAWPKILLATLLAAVLSALMYRKFRA